MRQRRQTGQGVIEYAGALVVAALLISFALSANMDQIVSGMYQAILGQVQQLLESKTPT